MKIHPVPRKRNIRISGKKLRRLPHVFSRVLELPFRSDADVVVEEAPDCFRFVAETDGIGEVRTHTVEIHPGVVKIVVRDGESLKLSLDQLELDMWRFRLPDSTLPELASAVFVDGELIVTVPKGHDLQGGDNGRGMGSGSGRLVLVQ
ncbi:heat shock protein [Trifolium repens]|nr:heat shock protein [Trifolium repens]